MKKNNSILFLGKKGDDHGARALKFCEDNFAQVTSYMGAWGDNIPPYMEWWDGDYIISYLSRWIIPENILKRAKIAAINFHPAPPDYPGIGCNNFALYEGANEYGVTCHHMATRVDTGNIIAVSRFSVFETDTVETILTRTYDKQIVLFYDIMCLILRNKPMPVSGETWTRAPFTRKQFNELSRISHDMDCTEMQRRIRATNYRQWKPTITINGFVFEYKGTE